VPCIEPLRNWDAINSSASVKRCVLAVYTSTP
jgi:hypothetical protein